MAGTLNECAELCVQFPNAVILEDIDDRVAIPLQVASHTLVAGPAKPKDIAAQILRERDRVSGAALARCFDRDYQVRQSGLQSVAADEVSSLVLLVGQVLRSDCTPCSRIRSRTSLVSTGKI